ncbi:MAG: hypothetical protein RPV21_10875 [Candidatus Sedimenticola sp. (ex Thyasira tokunagai)]
MMSSSNKYDKESPSKANQILEVEVVPDREKELKTFPRFKKWLSEILKETNLPERAEEAAEVFLEAEIQKRKREKVENDRLVSEIEFRLLQSKLSEQELEKNSVFREFERELLHAQTAKTLAEAEAIRTESRLKALKVLNELGVEVTPLIEDGEIKGVHVTKKQKLSQ